MKQLFQLQSLIWSVFAVLCSFSLQAQELNITGTVTAAGEPLKGVEIKVKNQNTSIRTDANGQYALKLQRDYFNPSQKYTLVVTHTDYPTREVPVNNRSTINIELLVTESASTETFQTGTANGQALEILPYSIGLIEQSDNSGIVGIDWQGRVAGLQVIPVNGQPGQPAFFQLRAANALANGQAPLLLLDGIFLNGTDLSAINPEDIEKVEILKGAVGGALYGSQGGNGVIQLFTKTGKELGLGQTQVSYRGEFGFTDAIRELDLNEFTNRMVQEADGPQPILGEVNESNVFDIPLPNLQNYQNDILFETGNYVSNALSIAGKSGGTNFHLSFQRLEDEGILQNNDGFIRHSFRTNLDHQLNDKFDLKLRASYSTSESDFVNDSSTGFLATSLSMTPIFDLNATNEEDDTPHDWDIDNTGKGITNPLYRQTNTDRSINQNRLLGNFTANFHPSDWLTFGYTATLDRAAEEQEQFVEKGYLSTSIPAPFGELATTTNQNSNGGGILRSRQTSQYFTSQFNTLVHGKILGFNTAVRTGFLYEYLTEKANQAQGENLLVKDIRSLDNAQSNFQISSDEQEIVTYNGFVIADIDYQNKYIFSGSYRQEGASLFGEEERSTGFYRVAAAYRLTEDLRFKPFQELKLRAAMGTAGIRPTHAQRFETFRLVNGTLTKQTLGNESLQPTRSTEREVGLSGTLFRAFDVEFNYITSITEDQIVLAPLSGGAGFNSQWQNAGTVEATIYEGSLNVNVAKLFRSQNSTFRWNIWGTFSKMEQTVTQLDIPSYTTGTPEATIFQIAEGQPLGQMVGEVFATSLDQLASQSDINPADYTLNEAGYVVRQDQLGTPEEVPYKLQDENGNPLLEPIGNIVPDFRVGIANSLEFGGVRLFALFDWKKGGSVYNQTKQYLYGTESHADLSALDIAASFYGENGLYNGGTINNHFVEDGAYFMLREASLSYTLDGEKLPGAIGDALTAVQVQLIGRNLWTKTDYSGFHPDVSSPAFGESLPNTPNGDPNLFAIDRFNYPIRRSFAFSVQLVF